MPGPGGRGRAQFLTEEEKKNSPKITKELLQRVFSYLKPYWRQLALVLVCIAVASVCSIFPSILTGNIIETILKNGGVFESTVYEAEENRYLERYWIDLSK